MTPTARLRRYLASVPPGYRLTASSICAIFDVTDNGARDLLVRLTSKGLVVRESRGVYRTVRIGQTAATPSSPA